MLRATSISTRLGLRQPGFEVYKASLKECVVFQIEEKVENSEMRRRELDRTLIESICSGKCDGDGWTILQ